MNVPFVIFSLTDKRIIRRQKSNILEMDVPTVAVVELDVDVVRVQLRVGGYRVRDRARVEVVILLTPVRANPSSGHQFFS